MTDLKFGCDVRWEGCGRDSAGTVSTGGQKVIDSAPSSMGGRGVGTSPEELLVSAVASCYSGTLFHLLVGDGLPADDVLTHAMGVVSDFPSRSARFARIVVNPTIMGGDSNRRHEYEACARTARNHCFIGQALHEAISYEVGELELSPYEPAYAEIG